MLEGPLLRSLSTGACRSQSNLTALQAAQLWPQVTKVRVATALRSAHAVTVGAASTLG